MNPYLHEVSPELFLKYARNSGLDDLSIDNLRCGRITRECMQYVREKIEKEAASRKWLEVRQWEKDMWMADELNDLLKAGQMIHEKLERGAK